MERKGNKMLWLRANEDEAIDISWYIVVGIVAIWLRSNLLVDYLLTVNTMSHLIINIPTTIRNQPFCLAEFQLTHCRIVSCAPPSPVSWWTGT